MEAPLTSTLTHYQGPDAELTTEVMGNKQRPQCEAVFWARGCEVALLGGNVAGRGERVLLLGLERRGAKVKVQEKEGVNTLALSLEQPAERLVFGFGNDKESCEMMGKMVGIAADKEEEGAAAWTERPMVSLPCKLLQYQGSDATVETDISVRKVIPTCVVEFNDVRACKLSIPLGKETVKTMVFDLGKRSARVDRQKTKDGKHLLKFILENPREEFVFNFKEDKQSCDTMERKIITLDSRTTALMVNKSADDAVLKLLEKEKQQEKHPELDPVKRKLLENDPLLEKQYIDLVRLARTVSVDEFFQGREAELELVQENLSQSVGRPSEAFAPDDKEIKKMSFKLTKSMVERIFIQHPDVRKKYLDNVPHHFSEEKFWSAYVYSKYLASTRSRRTTSNFPGGGSSKPEVNLVDNEDDDIEISTARQQGRSQKAKNDAAAIAADNLVERERKATRDIYRKDGTELFGETKEYIPVERVEGGYLQKQIHRQVHATDDDDDMEQSPDKKRRLDLPDRSIDPSVDLRPTLNDATTFSTISGLTETTGYGIFHRNMLKPELHEKTKDQLIRSMRSSDGKLSKSDENLLYNVMEETSDPLLSSLNLHGSAVLHENLINHPVSAARRFERLQKENTVIIEDLLDPSTSAGSESSQYQPLQVKQSNAEKRERSDTLRGGVQVSEAMELVRRSLTEKRAAMFVVPSPSQATNTLQEIESLLRQKQLQDTQNDTRQIKGVDESFRAMLSGELRKACELCRHFWAASSFAEKEKRSKVLVRIKEHRERLSRMREKVLGVEGQQASLLYVLIVMLDAAIPSE